MLRRECPLLLGGMMDPRCPSSLSIKTPPTLVPAPTTTGSRSLREKGLALLESTGAPWMSLYMPVDPGRNRIQLRNLLGQLRDDAPHAGLSQADIDPLLAPAEDLLHEAVTANEEMKGAALFLTLDAEPPTLLPLPFAPPLVAQIDERPWMRPLWRGVEPNGHFYVLSLWGGGAKLHRASRYEIDVIPPVGPQNSLNAVLRADIHIESELNWPTPAADADEDARRMPVIYKNQDDIRRHDYVEDGLLRFFRRLDDRARPLLGEESGPTPLVLAGPTELRRLYHEANTYHHLMEEGVDDQVRIQGTAALHRRAWEIVQPQFDQPRTEALDHFHASPERTAATPDSVLLAAVDGRIDTLFVAEDSVAWGAFDDDAHSVDLHSQRQEGDIEFLNAATARTLQTGGTVYVTDADHVPDGGPVAALLRY